MPLSPQRAKTGLNAGIEQKQSTINPEDALFPNRSQSYHGQQQQGRNALEQLAEQTSPATLENAVRLGMNLLKAIKIPLAAAASCPDNHASAWLDAITQVESRAQPFKTIVGVVGNTGTGKSSVINAVLDEERLLPTNCLRACTASPTEISYNHSDDPEKLYQAEIEFITAEDWIKELKIIFADLFDSNGNVSHECYNPDSEAGIAYAKIKSVYPKMSNPMIVKSSPEKLADEPAVRRVLGSVKKLQSSTSKQLFDDMQCYVDSKEKADYRKKKDVEMEYWPLIKVVRIYTKAEALSTGAVIVDLPGVQDSNAARAAVAQQYMKACTGLWIVAPINRAVDDKTAKSLLSNSFRRQLKFDGIYSAVTFICSKTDDISVIEATKSLNIGSDVSEYRAKINDLCQRINSLKNQLTSGEQEKADLINSENLLGSKREIWVQLSQRRGRGETVYPPSEKNSKKRKRGPSSSKGRKNRGSSSSDSSDSDSTIESTSGEESQLEDDDGQPLSEDQIRDVLSDLKAQRKETKKLRKKLQTRLSEIPEELESLQSEVERLQVAVNAICIQGRNEYSKGAIQRDFAMGIKELDQEAAIEQDENGFDPEEDMRDYDEVARNLPVFCVSSRAYQMMEGRLQEDGFKNDSFRNVNETEIPQLQHHAKKLTEDGRAATCRQFLNCLSQLLNSMEIWASHKEPQSHVSDSDKKTEEIHIRVQLSSLDRALATAVDDCIGLMKEALSECIYNRFGSAIPKAAEAAVQTATLWGAFKRDGGMHWSSYKATCRRDGVHTNICGELRDFNTELLEPITKKIATGWERVFQRRLPHALGSFAMASQLLLDDFHRDAVKYSEKRGTNHAGISMLRQQLRTHMAQLKEMPVVLRASIQKLQREANRGFQPVIAREMEPAYRACVLETGTGCYARMKNHMIDHVEGQRHQMFLHSTESVKAELQALCQKVKKDMTAHVHEIYNLLARDYLAVLVGVKSDVKAGQPSNERLLRAEILPILQDADRWFIDASGGDAATFKGPSIGDPGSGADGGGDLDKLAAAQPHEGSWAGAR